MVPELAEGKKKKVSHPHAASSHAKRAACGRGLSCIPFDWLRDRNNFNYHQTFRPFCGFTTSGSGAGLWISIYTARPLF